MQILTGYLQKRLFQHRIYYREGIPFYIRVINGLRCINTPLNGLGYKNKEEIKVKNKRLGEDFYLRVFFMHMFLYHVYLLQSLYSPLSLHQPV